MFSLRIDPAEIVEPFQRTVQVIPLVTLLPQLVLEVLDRHVLLALLPGILRT